MDIQNFEEVSNFIIDNTYVDGESLRQSVPDIEQNLAQAVEQAQADSEAFSLDKLRYPVALHRRMDGNKMVIEAPRHLQYCTDTSCQIYGADPDTWSPTPVEEEPSPVE